MVLLAYFEFYIKIVFLYKAGLFFVFFFMVDNHLYI